MKFQKFLSLLGTLALALLLHGTAVAQGVTTASMNGEITDQNGQPLIGANVLATHVPSGTTYGNAADANGFFRLPNLRVGGPYRVRVTYTGYEEAVEEGVYLSLGQTYQLNVEMRETAMELEGVEVVALRNDIFDGNRDGQKTVVDEETINNIPTITRSIGDYARFNPLANITEDSDGFAISLAGQNNRYNTIYIDGAVNNDAFGLADSGTNGGQTGANPISIDAIEEFTIAVAPFDVRQSGFAGGAINAVTRSGTNEFEGSAYYFLRNEDLAGKTPIEDGSDIERTQLAPFTAETYGFRLGGPIIKDKLFFFVNGELRRDETPMPFQFENYEGNSDLSTVNEVIDRVNNSFNYDPGTFLNNAATLETDKVIAKIDYAINQNHKLSLRHSYTKAVNLEARSSFPGALNFQNGSEFFTSTTNSSALELSSLFSSSLSNRLVIGATIVRDDRDPLGQPFPTVELQDGDNGEYNFGAERFSTANLLNQDVITVTNDLEIYKGRHSILFGVNFEYFQAGNLFIRNNFGRYRWFDEEDDDGNIIATGVERFLDGENADQFEHSFSQVDLEAGDDSEAIASFEQIQLGLYLQDEWQVSRDFKLSAGIRADIQSWPTDQPLNQQFNEETIDSIEMEGYDLKGARTGSFIGTQVLFSPRVGFNYDISGNNRTQLRGGAGVFTSRIPLVWPGGAYNNYGFNIGAYETTDQPFEPDVNKQDRGPDFDLDNPVPSGQVDLFAEDFKTPQVFKANLAIDHKFGNGFVATVEGIFTKVVNDVRYENLNLKMSERNLTAGPDDRPLFEGTQPGFGDDVIDDNYNYIMLASNTNKGYSYNIATTLSKRFANGLDATVSYSYSDAYSLFSGTSSQNNSQWRSYYNVNGRNLELNDPMRSPFAAGHRVFGQVSYTVDYPFATGASVGGKTKFSFNFNGQTGGYFSYVVGAPNFLFIDDGGFSNNELMYVPENFEESFLVDLTDDDGNVLYTAEEQWEILDAYIEDDAHLSDRRGDYTRRNGGVIPFEFVVDARLLQDFYIEMPNGKRNIIQLSVDVFNLTNLLNKNWGRRRFAGSFGNYNLINLRGNTLGNNTTPSYTVNEEILEGDEPWTNRIDDSGFRSSRWQMQVGLRYIFE